jgi:hypothetical protein
MSEETKPTETVVTETPVKQEPPKVVVQKTNPPTPPVVKPPTSVTLDWIKAESRITEIHEHLKSFEGKKGCNPFFYFNKFVKPLTDRYGKGERTEELYKQILSLKKETPTINLFESELQVPGIMSNQVPTANLWDGKKVS